MLETIFYVIGALVLLGVLITAHELGHFLAARWCGIEVKEFAIGMGPKIWSRKGKKGTQFSLRALPLGGFCMYYGEDTELDDPRAYNKQKVWKRALSIIAGPAMNFLLAFVVAVLFYLFIGVTQPVPIIGQVSENAPAQVGGMLAGDEIVSINGTAIANVEMSSKLVQQSAGAPLAFLVRRDGQELPLTVTPEYIAQENTYRIGIVYEVVSVPSGFGEAIQYSATMCVQSVRMMYDALVGMIFRGEGTEDVSGFIGTINIIQQETRTGGLQSYLLLAVVISINLGVMNLLPIPGLDGSRLIFCAFEAIFRRPVNRNVEGMIHFVGLVALMGLMLLFTYKDIMALFGQ